MPRCDQSRLDVAAAGTQAVLGFYLGGLGATLVLLARDFAVPLLTLGWLSSGFGAASLLMGVIGSKALRLGPERLARAAFVLLATGGVLIALAPVLTVAQLGALLLGVGGAVTVLCTPSLVVGQGIARRLTLVTAGSSVTGIVAPLALGLTDRFGAHGRLALLIPVPFALALAARRVPRPPVVEREGTHVVRRSVIARGWATMVLGISAEFCFVLWGAARLVDSGLTTGQAAGGAAAFPIGMAVARLAGARFAGRRATLTIACGCTALGALFVASPFGPAAVIAGLGVGGLGAAFLYPLTLSTLVETSHLPRRQVAPLATSASGVAVLFGPAVLRQVAEIGSLQLGFLTVLPMMALVVLVTPRTPQNFSSSTDMAAAPLGG
jgi:MFS family permease